MDRVARFNVLAMSGRAVEASGDVDVHPARQDRHDHLRQPARGVDHAGARASTEAERARGGAACRRSATRRPRVARSSTLARKRLAELGRPAGTGDDAGFAALDATIAEEIPFRAETRTSGVATADGATVLKGAVDAIDARARRPLPAEIVAEADRIADLGATPLALARDGARPRR